MGFNLKGPEIVVFLTTVIGTVTLLGYFFSFPIVQSASNTVILWGSVLARFARFAGFATLAVYFGNRLMKRQEGWQLALWTLIVMGSTLIIGLIPPLAANQYFNWLLVYMYGPTTMGFSALMGFSLVSACYRSMKIKGNYSTVVFFISWFCITATRMNLLGGIFNPLGDWVLTVPLEQGMRAIIIGSGIGTIAVSVRSMLGYERGMGGE